MLDATRIKGDFPIFREHPNLVYLDSTATSQKPGPVLRAVGEISLRRNANVHRGIYRLSELATDAYEQARHAVARFLGADDRELVFTRNATEAINLVAYAWGRSALAAGDRILSTELEHHSNLVPWQLLAKERRLRLEYVPVTEEGRLDLGAARRLIRGAKLLAVTHMSNVAGTVTPVRELVDLAHAAGALILLDGAQAAAHLPVNFRDLGADFYAFSGHKMLGPFGSGGLLARRELLESMEPFLGGGEMVREVTLRGSTWNEVPYKFEAGTPNVSGQVGLGAAVRYLQTIGMERVWQHERALVERALDRLGRIPGLRTYGPRGPDRGGVVAFTLEGVHPHDVASMLDERGIAVRAGHHCAQPLHARWGISSSARASFGVYTTAQDVDALAQALGAIREAFK